MVRENYERVKMATIVVMWLLWCLSIYCGSVSLFILSFIPYLIIVNFFSPKDKLADSKSLNLSGMGQEILHKDIGRLVNLEILDCSNNQLMEIPPEIGRLVNLVELHLNRNRIKFIPKEIINLENLEILDISDNEISILPPEIAKLGRLRVLNADNNPLVKPPAVVVNRGINAVRRFYEDS